MDDKQIPSDKNLSPYTPNQVIKPGETPETKQTPNLLEWDQSFPKPGSVIVNGQGQAQPPAAQAPQPQQTQQVANQKSHFKWPFSRKA